MRLLHTSDWHLGQTLHNFDRTYEHQCFLDWLLDTIVAEQADALLIAGDVFDNANPSAASQRQLYRFLQQARARSPQLDIVVIAGNHDSPGRLEAPGPLLEAHGTRVVGHVARDADGEIDLERMLVPLTGRTATVKPGASRCLPASGRRAAHRRAADAEGRQPVDAYLAGIALLYQQAYALARARANGRPGHRGDGPLPHGRRRFLAGFRAPHRDRRHRSPAGHDVRPAIAYAALGHLHLAQRVGKQEHLRYCGSPLPLSFAEIGYQHQVLRIDLDGERARSHRAAARAARGRAAARAGQPAPLKEVIAELVGLDLPDLPPHGLALPGSAGAARRPRAGPARPGRGGAGRQAGAPGEDRTDPQVVTAAGASRP
jgi:exonuclease SbcD